MAPRRTQPLANAEMLVKSDLLMEIAQQAMLISKLQDTQQALLLMLESANEAAGEIVETHHQVTVLSTKKRSSSSDSNVSVPSCACA